MSIIYNFIFLLFALVYLPVYLFKGKFHRGFLLRLGMLPNGLNLDKPIWLHAVSVGEVMSIRRLLEELRAAYPRKRFVISTVTPTGNKIAKSIAGENDFVTYLPLDLSFIIRGVIAKIKPCLFIIAETEIWPNLISCLYKKNIPVLVVNGRVSGRSFKGYRSINYLLRPVLKKISFFSVQSETDAQRLLCLGADKDKVRVSGNMKFDTKDYRGYAAAKVDYREKLGLGRQEKLFIAASTHPKEEEIVLGAYKQLKEALPDLRLMLAPRHPERAGEVSGLIKKSGLESRRISSLAKETPGQEDKQSVFILDTVGELVSFYAVCDIVFVGGSLVKKGGHNILEPAALGKPVLCGPYMFNFSDIAELFFRAQAAITVHSREELEEKVEYLLSCPQKADEMAKSAKEVILENQGATARNLEYIKNYMGG